MIRPRLLRRNCRIAPLFLLVAVSVLSLAFQAGQDRAAVTPQKPLEEISSAEFSRLIQDLSEEEGYFRSDNFTSNEASYLHVAPKLRELSAPGGAYIGVGPEQNFTYIAKVRPAIAFIVDIRRQAVIQHLLYKALFHISENRTEFLANLLCRPLAGDGAPAKDAPVDRLAEYFSATPASDEAYAANLARVRKLISETLKIPLSDRDLQRLDYVYSMFRRDGLQISFESGQLNTWRGGWYPTFRDLLLETDMKGNQGNFLVTEEDYQFVRNLQMRNRIIPVVGDFAGSKALAGVGGYLRRNNYAVRAFYTSNVEQFLFQNGVFGAFAENVRKFPVNDDSVIIRAVPTRGQPHPAQVAGHRITTILQKITVFLKDYDDGIYTSYWILVTTHYIPILHL